MNTKRRRLSRRTSSYKPIVVLVLIAAVAAVLPPDLTGKSIGLLQVLAPVQDAVSGLIGPTGGGRVGGVDDEARRRIAALRSIVVSLSAENASLKRENIVLTRLRDRGLGSEGVLIPARVIADDSLGWRASKLLLAGTRSSARPGQAVISNHFWIALPGDVPVLGAAVLASESLVGVVVHSSVYTSRVRLLSDPATRMAVAVGRVVDGAFEASDEEFWLTGLGGGRIRILDVHHRYVDEGRIRKGDVVLTRPDDPELPPNVTIGVITGIERNPDNPLLFALSVKPTVEPNRLRKVFVVDLERSADAAEGR